MQRCRICLYYSTHPFGIEFSNGVCSGCATHQEKNTIDWKYRAEYFQSFVDSQKNVSSTYDCVVPVSGDAEDYYVISTVLKYGLRPLISFVNNYFVNEIGWYNYHNLLTYFDLDSVSYNPDLTVYKELVRTSLRKHNHVLLPYFYLRTAFPVHIAKKRNIPLIIWGQNQAIEQVGKFSHDDFVQMSHWSRLEHDLLGVSLDALLGNGCHVDTRHLEFYEYPPIQDLNKVTGIYLSNYFRWDPFIQNAAMVKYGFKPEKNPSSFDPFERAGDANYYRMHDLLKLKRLGYRKIDDHVAREIRHQRISTKDGISILSNYSAKVYIRPIFDWLGVSSSGYEWFKKHRLSDVLHLITESADGEESIPVPHRLEALIKNSSDTKPRFRTFMKGI